MPHGKSEKDHRTMDKVSDLEETIAGHLTDGDDDEKDVDTDTVEENGDDEEYRDVPIDRGWAWMVALGSFMNHFIYSSYFFVVSVLFLDIMTVFKASATLVTFLLSMKAIIYCISTQLLVNLLMPVMSIRSITIISSFTNAVGTLFFVCIPVLPVFFIMGICKSISQGGAFVPSLTLVGHYFQRRRALATSISLLGTSLASIAVPPLVRYLKEEFGFRGAYLVLAGMEMNAIPASMLLRPLSRYRRTSIETSSTPWVKNSHVRGNCTEQKSKTVSHGADSRVDMIKATENCEERKLMLPREPSDDARGPHISADQEKTLITHAPEPDLQVPTDTTHEGPTQNGTGNLKQPNVELEDVSDSSAQNAEKNVTLSSSPTTLPDSKSQNRHVNSSTSDNNSVHGSPIPDSDLDILDQKQPRLAIERGDLLSMSLSRMVSSHASFDVFISQTSLDVNTNRHLGTNLHEDTARDERSTKHSKCWIQLRRLLKSLLDLSLLKNYLALLELASFTLTYASIYISVYLPSHAVKMGVSESKAALLLTIVGVVDVFTRLGFGFFADLGYVRPGKIIAAAAVCVGLVCQFSALYTSYAALVFMSVVCGAFAFLPSGLNAPLITDWLGVENLGKMLAFGTIVSALSSFFQYPLHGVIIEATGSFSASFHYIGASFMLGALCLLLEPLVRRLQVAKERRMERKYIGHSDRGNVRKTEEEMNGVGVV